MCGIFGYLGRSGHASEAIVEGLQRLEYRGYDSAGMCVVNHEKKIETIKAVGKVSNLKIKTESYDLASYHVGIGHTRWATHGGVSERNCHPHLSESGRFAVVHNGIIENYRELRDELIEKGYSFYSETDTEIVAKLFEDTYIDTPSGGGNPHIVALEKIIERMEGAYGLVFIDRDHPDKIFGMKKGSPMVIGFGKKGTEGEKERFISSDYQSLLGLIDQYIILEDGDIFYITPENYTILSGKHEIDRAIQHVDEAEKASELGSYQHFMLKEIWEQPQVLEDVFRGRINFYTNELHSDTLEDLSKQGIEKIVIVAPGTAYIAGVLGKYYLEELAGIPSEVVISAEFKYQRKFINPSTLFIFVSQSGETADTVDSLKIVKEQGGNVFGIVNVPGSSIARIAGRGLFTRAGAEIGVASTKAFTGMIACFLFLSLYLGRKRNMDYRLYREILDGLRVLPERIFEILERSESIRAIAQKYSGYTDFFYLGREAELAIALEGSLKLKELSYIHSEAYPAGELKHGPIALIDENFPTVLVNGGGVLVSKNNSSVQEIKARGGKVIGIIAENDPSHALYTDVLSFHSLHPLLNPFLEVVILQLFAYYIACDLGRDIDKPRNLAKSVTVE